MMTHEGRGSSRETERGSDLPSGRGSRDRLPSLFLRGHVFKTELIHLHLPYSSKRLCPLGWSQTAPFPGLWAGLLSSVTSGCCLHSGPIALWLPHSLKCWLPAPELSRDCHIDLTAQLHDPRPTVQIFCSPTLNRTKAKFLLLVFKALYGPIHLARLVSLILHYQTPWLCSHMMSLLVKMPHTPICKGLAQVLCPQDACEPRWNYNSLLWMPTSS